MYNLLLFKLINAVYINFLYTLFVVFLTVIMQKYC